MRRIALTVVLAASSLTACVSARANMLGKERYAPVPEDDVKIFLKETDVPSTCEKYALITTQGAADVTSKSQMIDAARRRAGKIGANGVLLDETRDPSTGTRIASALIGISANRKGEMVAYRCE